MRMCPEHEPFLSSPFKQSRLHAFIIYATAIHLRPCDTFPLKCPAFSKLLSSHRLRPITWMHPIINLLMFILVVEI